MTLAAARSLSPVVLSLRHRSAVPRDRNKRVTAHNPGPGSCIIAAELRCRELRKLQSREATSSSVRGPKLRLEFVDSRAVRFVVLFRGGGGGAILETSRSGRLGSHCGFVLVNDRPTT